MDEKGGVVHVVTDEAGELLARIDHWLDADLWARLRWHAARNRGGQIYAATVEQAVQEHHGCSVAELATLAPAPVNEPLASSAPPDAPVKGAAAPPKPPESVDPPPHGGQDEPSPQRGSEASAQGA